jgi:hypothetical protein
MSTHLNHIRPAESRKPVDEFAREFATTANSFADSFIQHVAPGAELCDATDLSRDRREVCAALWAILLGTFEASALSTRERTRLVPLVRQEMLAAWNKHCSGDSTLLNEITERSARYLKYLNPASFLETAVRVIRKLMKAIDKPANSLEVRSLAALVAHRMIVDLRRLNDATWSLSVE